MTIQLNLLPGVVVRVAMWGDDVAETERLIVDYAGDEIEFHRDKALPDDPSGYTLIGYTDIITASTWVRRVLSLEAVR